MLLIDMPINIEFYFTFDNLLVVHSTDYQIVQDVYNEYFEKYGYKHEYYLYTVGKYNLKMRT